jgi:hypothetical protein
MMTIYSIQPILNEVIERIFAQSCMNAGWDSSLGWLGFLDRIGCILKSLFSLIPLKLDFKSMVVFIQHFPVWLENPLQRRAESEGSTCVTLRFHGFCFCIAALSNKLIQNFVIQYCNGIGGASDFCEHHWAILIKNLKKRRLGNRCHSFFLLDTKPLLSQFARKRSLWLRLRRLIPAALAPSGAGR